MKLRYENHIKEGVIHKQIGRSMLPFAELIRKTLRELVDSKMAGLFILLLILFFSARSDRNLSCIYGSEHSNSFGIEYSFETRVHRAGIFWMAISNRGIVGKNYWMDIDPCTGNSATICEMPTGSGDNYLESGSLWFGGYLDSLLTSVNQFDVLMFQGPLVSTGMHRMSYEFAPVLFDSDPSGKLLGKIKESSNIEGRLNCLFEDVYDPVATSYEQMTVYFSDKFVNRTYTGYDNFDKRDHIPLGLEVKQISRAWPYDYAKKFIIVDYTIYNRNSQRKDIYDFFVGYYCEHNISKRTEVYPYQFFDDVCGYVHKWDNYIDPATGEKKVVDMNMVWAADNDGRNYEYYDSYGWFDRSEPLVGTTLNGATGIFSIRVLRNPNSNLRFNFNYWSTDFYDESLDWGPRWKTGLHSNWQYDLSQKQKGYDDTNYDEIVNLRTSNPQLMFGGRTEGTPIGDRGKYMVMSNDEFDFDITDLRRVYLGEFEDPQYLIGTWQAQSGKWQRYTTPETFGMPEYSSDIIDGSVKNLNDLANGYGANTLLSFGPLGYESYVNVATDLDHDGVIDSYIPNKQVWKFAYGDSLKLTLAFMVSENFHTSLEQDPNYRDSTVVDLTDGLDVSLFDQGWYDAFYNVVWAERVYDTPMFDTPVKRWGETKKDGWYGEDVGADAMFGDLVNDTYCWWLDASYPGPDGGEGDFEITVFTNPVTDIDGFTSTNEDNLLPFGRKESDDEYGPTGNAENGEGYGYMVKYDKLDGVYPQGTWVRYGFDNDRLDAGDGVPDFTSPPPPPSPKIKVTELNNEIIVEWSSHEFYTGEDGSVGVAGPEHTYDPYTRLYDFEGYHIELSPDRQSNNFTTIFSVDRMNYSYQNTADLKDYYDNPIPADTVLAYPESYPAIITANGKTYQLVSYGDNRDLTADHSVPEMFSYTCTTEPSPYPGWDEIRNYKFVLHNQTLAQMKFIAVTASDFGAPKMGVPPIKSSPESNVRATVTATLSKAGEVIVVPNPYRGDVKYTEMGWEDLDGNYTYDEGYRKIAFLNIPERCVIRIYTLAGDLVKVIMHNGNSEWDTLFWYGKNGAYWNLINDNKQAAMSGIYLFSVQDADKKKDDFVGKFVIIK
jgi:hypothetical protein